MVRTIVVKIGSSTLTGGTKRLSKPNMLALVRQIALIHQQGHRLILVSSGAMAAGRDHLGDPKLPSSLPAKQMLSAVGQGQLMQIYSMMFDLYDVKVGQVLVTGDDLRRNRARYLNTRDTIETLLDYRIVPIINENDTVTVDEIKVGDNDNLSALVASLINAELLILLTDRDGLYNKDPRHNLDAQRIDVVLRIDDDIRATAGGVSSSGLGVGGMQTKIQAAEFAGRSGIETIIASGSTEDVLLRLLDGEPLGTRFPPMAPRVESRKRWLLSEPAEGVLVVDAGAVRVLKKGHVSLLPVGITHVHGHFERGALVEVKSPDASLLARGQVTYSADELRQLVGIKSNRIEEILGYTYGDAAIHRDNMAMLAMEDE